MRKKNKALSYQKITALLISGIAIAASATPTNNSSPFIEKTDRSADTGSAFSFTTASGINNTTCTLEHSGNNALVISAYPDNSCTSSPMSTPLIINEPSNPGDFFTLEAAESYRLTNFTITTINNNFHTSNNSYPQSIKLSQVYCMTPLEGPSDISPTGCWKASCSSSGCTDPGSQNVTVTFPSGPNE